jgi:UDP-4-amino-4,6-dideoxy-N-acetyl-beta-L-altrosamine N-acetyltransferase
MTQNNNIILKDFINLSYAEHEEVLAWRNHELVRTQMFSSHIISIQEHLDFVAKLTNTKTKRYYRVEWKDKPIGVIDFYDITTEDAYYGLYLNPDLIREGAWGILLEYIALDFAFHNLNVTILNCESLATNQSVLNIHYFFGQSVFKQTKTVVYMRITNDEWNIKRNKLARFINKFL